MQLTSHQFKSRVSAKLTDADLQGSLKKLLGNFVEGRVDRVAELDNFSAIRVHALNYYDRHLATFDRNATARAPSCIGRQSPQMSTASCASWHYSTASRKR